MVASKQSHNIDLYINIGSGNTHEPQPKSKVGIHSFHVWGEIHNSKSAKFYIIIIKIINSI